ncbi:MAG: tRNA pseudouridine(55) synthase TruB [Gammaproteobacteria bacterium]|nr:tRNA pseudouridine(55) synthase TruB [Gammaproteobacteria bacterium]
MSRRRKQKDSIQGILLLDKPVGLSSNAALQRVKRFLRINKAGHTGSLDPLASGLLPVCVGEATKLSSFLLNADKGYVTTVKLGENTSTGDSEGEVVQTRPVEKYTEEQIEQVLQQFRGEITQMPPMYSAIKQNGQPLYKLARQGIEVERETRQLTIHSLQVVNYEHDMLTLDVHCSKGTYIRTLAEDIGNALGCGGHVQFLRRTQVGTFTLENAVTLDELEQTYREQSAQANHRWVLPMEDALADWPDVTVSGDAAHYLKQGQPVLVPRAPTEGFVRLFEAPGHFVGVGHILDDGRVAPKRLINLAT